MLGAGSAALEAVWTPGFWLIPVLAAGVGNAFLAWFARSTVERSWAWLLPAVPWLVVMVASVATTAEGDQVANSWTGLATFAAGAFAFFPAAFRRPTPPPPAPRAPADVPPMTP